MVTHSKFQAEELQNPREGESCAPRMCQGDSSRTKVDCLRVNIFEKWRERTSEMQGGFFKRFKITALDSLTPSPCCCQLTNSVPCLAGPIFPWSVEGAVKHILAELGGPSPLCSLTRCGERAPYWLRHSSPLADLAAVHFGWGLVFSPWP